MNQPKNQHSPDNSYSPFHPTSLTDFQPSTNCCVNIKEAELDVVVSSSKIEKFHKRSDKEACFTRNMQPIIFSKEVSDCKIETQECTNNTASQFDLVLRAYKPLNAPPVFIQMEAEQCNAEVSIV